MATIGRVVVDVDANTAKFDKRLKNSIRTMSGFGRRMRRVGRVAGRQFTRALGAAVAALTALTIAGVRAGDDLAKTSAKLGIAANQLAGLRLAAEQSGVATKQLDLGLQRMVRRVAEAAQGVGEAKDALAELGLNARALAALSPDEQFRRVADAFEQVGNQSDRVRLGFKLFDSEGVALVNTLALGRKELDRFSSEAERLGLTLEGTQLRGIEAAADAGNILGKAFSGLGRQLAATFAPAMELAANATTEFVSSITQSIPKMAGFASAVLGISRAVDKLTLKETRAELIEVFKALVDAESELIEAQERVRRAASVGGDLRSVVAEVEGNALRRAVETFVRLTLRSQDLQRGMRELKETVDETVQSIAVTPRRAIQPFLDLVDQANTDLDKFINKQEELARAAGDIIRQTRKPVEEFVEQMKLAREVFRAGLINEEDFERFRTLWLDKIIAPVEKLKPKSVKVFDDMAEAGKQAARNIQDAFADFLFDPFENGVKGMLKSFLTAIRRMLANQAAIELFGFIKKIFKIGTPGGGGSPPKPTGGFARGGSFRVGGVGGTDSQVRFIRASPNETVTVNRPGDSRGGDIIVNNEITVNGADPERTAEILGPLLEANRAQTIADLQQMRRTRRF